jgi:hypothetical protein
MQQEVQQDEDESASAVNEKHLMNNGGSSHKVGQGTPGGLGPNHF